MPQRDIINELSKHGIAATKTTSGEKWCHTRYYYIAQLRGVKAAVEAARKDSRNGCRDD